MYEEENEITEEEERELLQLLSDEELQWPPLPADFVSNVLARLGIPSSVQEATTEQTISARSSATPEELYQCGREAEKDGNYTLAVEQFRQAVEQGHARAQIHLATLYFWGKGVAEDPVEAAKWWRRAAEQGHAEAQNTLATLYFWGKGVAEDPVEAAKWRRRAAEQGHAKAQNVLDWKHVEDRVEGRGVA